MGSQRPPIRRFTRGKTSYYFFAAAFLAGAFLATAFLAGAFLAGAFLAGAFLAAVATFPPWDSTLNQCGPRLTTLVKRQFAVRHRAENVNSFV